MSTFQQRRELKSDRSNRRRSPNDDDEDDELDYIGCICTADMVDKMSTILFPTMFTVFNAIYWWCYIGPGSQAADGFKVTTDPATNKTPHFQLMN